MKPSEYIRRGWTTGTYARDAAGKRCDMHSPRASCWCASAAIILCIPVDNDALRSFTDSVLSMGFTIAQWNDAPGRTQQEVIEALEAHGL